ncbi:hypothetical protein [Terricaulis silvestris]|uniref:Lipoprotein n=1 Tax=Terricaulis silvestris TaxID=2686094 RepID=A0A6I6MIU5_9CAUL|nr:hypothetical protein [Terricaulis silvestris]QGZ95075.1 hypothetical protein DSM104635_01916 [Terricaulis silvestris]
MMRVALIACAASLSACTTAPMEGTYAGMYFSNFETSSFTPDNSRVSWVAHFEDQSDVKRISTLMRDGAVRARSVMRGRVERCGGCGNLGAFDYIFHVSDVIELTPVVAD